MRTFYLQEGEGIVIGRIIIRVLEVGDAEVRLLIERPEDVSTDGSEAQELVCEGAGELEPAI